MINNTVLPPVTQPSLQRPAQSPSQAQTQIQDQVQNPERASPVRPSANRERENPLDQKVEYIPAIPDEEALATLRSVQSESRQTGPAAAYGDVETMSAAGNRGRFLDTYA